MPECRGCGKDVALIGGRVKVHGCPEDYARWDDEEGFRHERESRFTDPRKDCPHPERWHAADADSTEDEVTDLVAAFVRALRPDIVVETGSAWGRTAFAIGDVIGGGTLYTIEPNGERAAATRNRCGGMRVEVIEKPSLDWDPVDGIGFAWLDSLLDLRAAEFRHLYPHFAPGAFVGFHDTGPHRQALRDQIEALEAEGLLLPVFLPTPRGVCFAEVVR